MNTAISKNDIRALFLNQKRMEKELGALKRVVTVALTDELSPKTLRKAEKTSLFLDKNDGKKFYSATAFNTYLKAL